MMVCPVVVVVVVMSCLSTDQHQQHQHQHHADGTVKPLRSWLRPKQRSNLITAFRQICYPSGRRLAAAAAAAVLSGDNECPRNDAHFVK
uniref:Putative secreted protein n=1 Tax=Anopheles darlingi TaxID=43151 RepID=A0A2M4DLN5_ANODA